jgi:hypothetical protein
MMLNTHSALRQVGQLYLAVSMGAILLLLTACAGSDEPVSNDDVQTPAVQGAITQVIGTVTDMDGNLLAEVGIAVTEGTAPTPEILMLSGEDGKYTWPLPAGTFTLTARKDGYKELSQEVVVKEGETTRLDFKLEKLP